MLKFIFTVIFLLSTFYSPNLWSLGNYDSCILKNIKEIGSDIAAREIIDICTTRHEDKPNSICIETDAKITNNIIFLKNIAKPFSGENYCEYPKFEPKSRGYIQNGKKENKWIWWHRNGNVGLEINYIEGKKNGKLIKWYNDQGNLTEPISLEGQMQLEENYKDDKKDGQSTTWYPDGQIQLEENYKDDKKDGQLTMWYPDGQMQLEVNYKDDKKDGQSITWYQSGQIFKDEIYKYGKKDGKSTWWDLSGRIMEEKTFKDGVCISGDC